MRISCNLKYICIFFFILLLLVFFPSICTAGATKGLLLWFNTIVPTLFPFFLITRLILAFDLIPKKLTFIYPVFTGLIAGYPTGAITINELIREEKISVHTGQILLILCNNASPGFLIGVASLAYPGQKYCMWACTIVASFLVTLIYLCIYFTKNKLSLKKTPVSNNRCLYISSQNISDNNSVSFIAKFEDTMIQCFKTLVIIGGYIIVFSILSDYLSLIISDCSPLLNGFISGICEITTGITTISSQSYIKQYTTQYNTSSITTLCIQQYCSIFAIAFLCGFGGICAFMQTSGVLENSGLSMKKYMFHKIICGLIAGLLALMWYLSAL